MKKICLIFPVLAALTVTVADCVIEAEGLTAAVAVYVVVVAGFTLAEPIGSAHEPLHTELPEASVTDIEVAVPPETCHASVAIVPEVIVLGEAVRLSANGTVTVTVDAAEVPPGPVAVIWNVVVLVMGVTDDPEVGNGPLSSVWATAGVMVTEVAFVVVQLMVEGCPALTNIGLAVNDVTCGLTGCATCTVTVCGEVLPWDPVATAE